MKRKEFIKSLAVLAAAPVVLPLIPVEPISFCVDDGVDGFLVHSVAEEAYLITEGIRFINYNHWIPIDDSVYGVYLHTPRRTGLRGAMAHFTKTGKFPPPYELLNNFLTPQYAKEKEKVWIKTTVKEMETLSQSQGNNQSS